MKVQNFHIPPAHTNCYHHPYQSSTFITIDEAILSSRVYVRFSPCAVNSIGLGKYIMACVHHSGIIQDSFNCPKNYMCWIEQYPSQSPNPWKYLTPNIFTFFIVLPLPECYTFGNILVQNTDFQVVFFHLLICS